MNRMTAPELAALRELCDKATPGDWEVAHKERVSYVYANTKIADVYSTAFGDKENQIANGELIAAARTALPRLLDEVEEARAFRREHD